MELGIWGIWGFFSGFQNFDSCADLIATTAKHPPLTYSCTGGSTPRLFSTSDVKLGPLRQRTANGELAPLHASCGSRFSHPKLRRHAAATGFGRPDEPPWDPSSSSSLLCLSLGFSQPPPRHYLALIQLSLLQDDRSAKTIARHLKKPEWFWFKGVFRPVLTL